MSKPVYTLEDVKKHNNNKDCWLVIKNKVYDVTKFLEQHPGGEEVLLDVGGKNATQDFEDVGHSEEAHKMMQDYYIGDLATSSGTAAEAPKQKETAKKPTSSTTPSPKSSSESSVMTYVIPIGLLVVSVVAYFAFGRGH